jgi:hypothetical protein
MSGLSFASIRATFCGFQFELATPMSLGVTSEKTPKNSPSIWPAGPVRSIS